MGGVVVDCYCLNTSLKARLLRLHLSHAIEATLYRHRINVVIHIPKLRAHLVIELYPTLVGKICSPEQSHGCCPVHYHTDVYFLPKLGTQKGLMG